SPLNPPSPRMADGRRTFAAVKEVILSVHADEPAEEKIHCYDKWALNYEEDVVILDYHAPRLSVECLVAHFPQEREKALVLDVACGTGLVAMELQKHGFRNFHGVDGSGAMLHLANKKGLYQELKQCVLGNDPLPAAAGTYDVVLMVGVLGDGQAPPGAVSEVCRVTKPGGYVCMTMRKNVSERYWAQLQAALKQMEQTGLWERIAVQDVKEWEKDVSSSEAGSGAKYISGVIYLYRKSVV
uniref:Methyltransferase like 27 n=1 Tax=Latimeria chalumnae TaxID=7897 RepID=H3AVG7_LATCH